MRLHCGLLKNAWYVAARSEQVRTSRPHGCNVLGELLVLWRGRDGAVAALADRCPHRNALLSAGHCDGATVRCPYHGWTFDRDGTCVHVPSLGPDVQPPRRKSTEAFPVRERDGLVWVWMGGEVVPDVEPFAMPFADVAGWQSYFMVTEFNGGVTDLVENFMDVPHTVFVHRGWFRSRRGMPVRTTVERRASEVLVTYHQERDSIGFSDRVFNPGGLPMSHTDHFFMPNVTRVDYLWGGGVRGFAITSACTPVDASHTRVYTHIAYKYGPLGRIAAVALPWYTRRVTGQDVAIVALQRRALDHYGGQAFASTPADVVHRFIESLREHAEGGGVGPAPAPQTEELTLWI